jgi:quinol monooxygenase YgiN
MYGTVARMHVKPGMGAQLEELDRQEAEMGNIAGYVGEVVYQMDAEPDVYYLAVIFESKAAYDANATSPEQNERYEQFRALLVEDPEWHDGEIVRSFFRQSL